MSVSTRIISLGSTLSTPFSFIFDLLPHFVAVSIIGPTPLTFQGSEKFSFIQYQESIQDNRLTKISSMSSFLMKNFIAVTLTSFRNKCVEIETSQDQDLHRGNQNTESRIQIDQLKFNVIKSVYITYFVNLLGEAIVSALTVENMN